MLFTFCFFTVFLLDFLVKFCIYSDLSSGLKSLCSYTFVRKYINIHKEVKVYLDWNICSTLEGINYSATLNSVDWGEVNGKLLHLECLKKQKFKLLGLFVFDPCLEFATVIEHVIAMKCANWLLCYNKHCSVLWPNSLHQQNILSFNCKIITTFMLEKF